MFEESEKTKIDGGRVRRRATAAFVAATVLLGGSANALTFLELTTGDDAYVPDARGAAMGRTRAAEPTGAFTTGTNPALLGTIETSEVALGGEVFKNKETRSIPAFDSFDSFIVESAYALNDEYQYHGGVGAVVRFVPNLPSILGLGISFAPIWDFEYDYVEEVRDNNAFTQPRDELLAINEVRSDGKVNAWTFGAGVAAHEYANVGAAFQILTGEENLLHQTTFELEPQDSVDAATQRIDSLSGVRGVFGVSVKPGSRLQAGVVWRTETTLDGDFSRTGDPSKFSYLGTPAAPSDTAGSLEITYPNEIAFGAAFYPRAKLVTAVRVDVGWTEWSAFRHGLLEDLELDDVWDARVGIEHVFYNDFAARLGFRFTPSPQNDEIASSAFTFGGGLDLGALHADLAFEVGSREYRFDDLFDDSLFGGNSRTEADLVEESTLSGFLTMSYELDGLFQ